MSAPRKVCNMIWVGVLLLCLDCDINYGWRLVSVRAQQDTYCHSIVPLSPWNGGSGNMREVWGQQDNSVDTGCQVPGHQGHWSRVLPLSWPAAFTTVTALTLLSRSSCLHYNPSNQGGWGWGYTAPRKKCPDMRAVAQCSIAAIRLFTSSQQADWLPSAVTSL